MTVKAARLIDILDMIDFMTTYHRLESISIEEVSNALDMRHNDISAYLNLLSKHGKIEWCDETSRNQVRLSPDGYITLQHIQDVQSRRFAIALNA
ncbi:MAG: hypothetical protein GFH27_549309n146 [Chloroflexi bacterium AL-W]|nr:hypothetical protein [Chloroflexi bacterium AL-N1]NOK69848.1 hypothetical protein [Chloroflexi bacterium AL-N10]NOK73548.1 hypothetical protein [Chloroflexi bacterium AL-N5]NOK84018.1 hypothetical protein [Chloroflexi bacterium AL-W]NOK87879.1 hypothetical protein [Chloroflexi bacterium AL-N15]